MADINLVPEEAKKTEDFDKLRGKIIALSVAILALTAIGAIVTLAFFAFYVSQREKLITRVEAASAKVDSFQATESLLVVTKDKVSTADKILTSRVDYLEFFDTLIQIIPTNIFFTSITVGRDSVAFNGKAKTSADIAGLFSTLTSQEGEKIISGVELTALSSDQTREYTFAFTAKLAGSLPPPVVQPEAIQPETTESEIRQ